MSAKPSITPPALQVVTELALGGPGEETTHIWRLGPFGPLLIFISEWDSSVIDYFPPRVLRLATDEERHRIMLLWEEAGRAIA